MFMKMKPMEHLQFLPTHTSINISVISAYKISPDDISIQLDTPPPHTTTTTNTHCDILWLSLSFSFLRHGAFSVYTDLTRADYYSVAIKSQFGVGRLSGRSKGHSTRQIVGSIEMDGAVKVEPASLVWKSVCKNLGVATNLTHRPLQNINARMNVFKWQTRMRPSIWNVYIFLDLWLKWLKNPDTLSTGSAFFWSLLL